MCALQVYKGWPLYGWVMGGLCRPARPTRNIGRTPATINHRPNTTAFQLASNWRNLPSSDLVGVWNTEFGECWSEWPGSDLRWEIVENGCLDAQTCTLILTRNLLLIFGSHLNQFTTSVIFNSGKICHWGRSNGEVKLGWIGTEYLTQNLIHHFFFNFSSAFGKHCLSMLRSLVIPQIASGPEKGWT